MRRIPDFTLKELMQLDVGSWFDPAFSNERILSLAEFLDRYGDKMDLYIELKTHPIDGKEMHGKLVEKMVETILLRKPPKIVYILSFEIEILQNVFETTQELKYVLNIKGKPPLPLESLLRKEFLHAFCYRIDILSKSIVKEIHQAGKDVWTYSCDSEDEVAHALDAGVDTILTNRPHWLTDYLNTYNLN